MTESKGIKQEYLSLKNKLEDRIKELEERCVDHSRTRLTIQPPHSPQFSHVQSHHQFRSNFCRHGHHHHFCHSSRCPAQSHYMANSVNQLENNLPSNISINEALIENLKAQKQMNSNLKILSDKLSDLSVKKSQSSAFFDEHHSNPNGVGLARQQIGNSKGPHCERAKSLSGFYTRKQPKSKKSYNSRKSANGEKKPKNLGFKRMESEYFAGTKGDSKCPVHCNDNLMQIYEQRLINKQIYKDSNHRNRRHERNHMIHSFYLQQKSRKQLLTKIAKNFFNNYGVK